MKASFEVDPALRRDEAELLSHFRKIEDVRFRRAVIGLAMLVSTTEMQERWIDAVKAPSEQRKH